MTKPTPPARDAREAALEALAQAAADLESQAEWIEKGGDVRAHIKGRNVQALMEIRSAAAALRESAERPAGEAQERFRAWLMARRDFELFSVHVREIAAKAAEFFASPAPSPSAIRDAAEACTLFLSERAFLDDHDGIKAGICRAEFARIMAAKLAPEKRPAVDVRRMVRLAAERCANSGTVMGESRTDRFERIILAALAPEPGGRK